MASCALFVVKTCFYLEIYVPVFFCSFCVQSASSVFYVVYCCLLLCCVVHGVNCVVCRSSGGGRSDAGGEWHSAHWHESE